MKIPAVFITRVLFVLGFFILIDLYSSETVKTLENFYNLKYLSIIWWSISLLIYFSILTVLFLQVRSEKPDMRVFMKTGTIGITLFLPKLLLCILLFGEDILRISRVIILGIWNLISAHDHPFWMDRSVTYSTIAIILAFVFFLFLLYGISIGKYNYQVKKINLSFPELPSEFNGFRIIQISDIHSGSLGNTKQVEKGIKIINDLNPDLILFTGDLVNNVASEIEKWISTFKKLQAKNGKFSILGNHDYGDYVSWPNPESKRKNLEKLIQYHKEIGFHLLLNESVKISKNHSHFNLTGIENWGSPPFPQYGDLKKALNGVDPDGFTILMSHDPSHWKAEVLNFPFPVQLTLSGHTHGMQFGIEIGKFKWSPVKYRYPEWAGLYTSGKKHLYVNRGFGFIGFLGRVGIFPEITLLELNRNIN